MGAWGLGLFQSDQDLDIVGDLGDEAGLNELQEEAEKRAKAAKPEVDKSTVRPEGDDNEEDEDRVHLSLSANCCSDPELVREHLDSGILAKLVAKHEQGVKPSYEFVILGACAMSLGCTLPTFFKDHLQQAYKSVGLMRDAVQQMKKALHGPDGFTDGTPFNFNSPGLMETMERGGPADDDRLFPGSNMLNVQAPGGFSPKAMQDIERRMKEGKHGNDRCGGCGAEQKQNGGELQSCSKCKKRKYCSKECQKGHWKLHKKVCEAPAEGKENVGA